MDYRWQTFVASNYKLCEGCHYGCDDCDPYAFLQEINSLADAIRATFPTGQAADTYLHTVLHICRNDVDYILSKLIRLKWDGRYEEQRKVYRMNKMNVIGSLADLRRAFEARALTTCTLTGKPGAPAILTLDDGSIVRTVVAAGVKAGRKYKGGRTIKNIKRAGITGRAKLDGRGNVVLSIYEGA